MIQCMYQQEEEIFIACLGRGKTGKERNGMELQGRNEHIPMFKSLVRRNKMVMRECLFHFIPFA